MGVVFWMHVVNLLTVRVICWCDYKEVLNWYFLYWFRCDERTQQRCVEPVSRTALLSTVLVCYRYKNYFT